MKYKDELIDDLESYLSRRCKYYSDLMDRICEKHGVGDDWLDLPEIPLRQYNTCAKILGELGLIVKDVNRIRIANIADEKQRLDEYNTQCCIDMGR